MNLGLTISQAAAVAGVTVKTVRHYHRLRLFPEPRRDPSGYRRYGSAELLRLVAVRTLAEAGVPLGEIVALLDAEPPRRAADLAKVRQGLTERIDALTARRDMLDRLAGGARLLLPDRVQALLARAVDLGLPDDFVAASETGLMLVKALVRDFDAYLDQIDRAFDDTGYVDLLKRSWEASRWPPDDPRVEDLATAIADYMVARPDLVTAANTLGGYGDARLRYGVINDFQARAAPPAGARLSNLIEAKLRAARKRNRSG